MNHKDFFRRLPRRVSTIVFLSVLGLAGSFLGCTTLNPAFVDLFDPAGGSATVANSSGPVAIAFINNAEVDERLLTFLQKDLPDGGGVQLTPVEKRTLHPRFRFRVRVDFANGNFNIFEFVSGSSKLVDQQFDTTLEPDLTANDLTNTVAVCDVSRIQILGPIEVFIPTRVEVFQFQRSTVNNSSQFVTQGFDPASLNFIPLQVDTVDMDGNTVLQQNIGIRDVPVPVDNPRCGSVVAIVISGSLSVPFLFDNPSVLDTDTLSQARIGGRYQIKTLIK